MELCYFKTMYQSKYIDIFAIWRRPSLSELTPIIFNTGLTHLGSVASIYTIKLLQDKSNQIS